MKIIDCFPLGFIQLASAEYQSMLYVIGFVVVAIYAMFILSIDNY